MLSEMSFVNEIGRIYCLRASEASEFSLMCQRGTLSVRPCATTPTPGESFRN